MGKRVNLGKADHETVCRVWGLLGSELHEIVTSVLDIHICRARFSWAVLLYYLRTIMTQDTEARPLNVLIVGAGKSSNKKYV